MNEDQASVNTPVRWPPGITHEGGPAFAVIIGQRVRIEVLEGEGQTLLGMCRDGAFDELSEWLAMWWKDKEFSESVLRLIRESGPW